MNDDHLDMSWASDAACKKVNPDLFYADHHTMEGRIMQSTALNICRKCSAREACMEYGLMYERYGVWGGMTEIERHRYRQRVNMKTKLDRFNMTSLMTPKTVVSRDARTVRITTKGAKNER